MKAKTLLLLCLSLFAGTKTFAYDAEIDGIYYNFFEYGAVVTSTSSNPKYSGAVVIPATVTFILRICKSLYIRDLLLKR